jgi:hypothetical protein
MKHVVKHSITPWAGQSVWFTQDLRAMKVMCKKAKRPFDPSGANGVMVTTDGPYLIYVRKGADLTSLVHETAHATLDALAYVGINAHQADGEPFTYTQQAMLKAFLPHFKSPKTPK